MVVLILGYALNNVPQWFSAFLSYIFAENIQIPLKISVILILLTFIHLVSLNMVVNNQLNPSLGHKIVTKLFIGPKLRKKNLFGPINFFSTTQTKKKLGKNLGKQIWLFGGNTWLEFQNFVLNIALHRNNLFNIYC